MPRPLKSDTATSADWSFTANDELMQALRGQAERWASTYERLNADDAFQDICLWLSVRPQKQKLSIPFILNSTNSRLQGLVKGSDKRSVEVAFDDELLH